jgi:hypothetical protein
MVEDDECVGYKCKFALCFFRPSALNISSGVCDLKEKKKRSRQSQEISKRVSAVDPVKYRHFLNKKMKKNFKLKDFY